MKFTSDKSLVSNLSQLVPKLLKAHSYGLYELAQECSQQLHSPICEIMPSLGSSLHNMITCGELHYDRQHNRVFIG
ncbi:hypothetical protein Lepto7375DRAFT_7066 [Leptolyngbya sp. PCC 7375]|nr:hypothetical protein Lepto7375DRAFT_7066 [Leptolyngbya sp. PCC 7375]